MTEIQFERGPDDELADVKAPMKNAQHRYEKIMGTLTLFSPQEDDPVCCEPGPVQDVINQRPVTPIEEEIKAAPATLTHLKKLVRRRIQPRPSPCGFKEEEQLEMAGMLMGEVSAIWMDLQDQVDYPFFSYALNRELNRRVAVHVVTVCSELFKQYLTKAEVYQKRKIYSDEANLVRLKSELALEAREFLKVGTVRLLILKEMQKANREHSASVTCFYPETLDPIETPKDPNMVEMKAYQTYKDWIQLSNHQADEVQKTDLRGAPRKAKHRFTTAKEELKSLAADMPSLNTAKLLPLLKNMPRNLSAEAKKSSRKTDTAVQSEQMAELDDDIDSEGEEKDGIFHKEEFHSLTDYDLIANLGRAVPKLERADSMPEILVGQNILNELEITIENWFPNKEVDEKLLKFCDSPESDIETEKPISLETVTREQLRQDLINLKSHFHAENDQSDDELPPLVRNTSHIPSHVKETKNKNLAAKLKELDEKEAQRQKKQRFKPTPPEHPQPATVTREIGDKVIRASDIRPSERQCLSEVTLSLFGPLWNDLLDQIDAPMVKKLDSNLFRGEEIREVYREIIKTVPREHLDFTKDSMVQSCPQELDLSLALASSTLRKKRKIERVINPSLKRKESAPWGNEDSSQWGKAKVDNPQDKKGSEHLENIVEQIVREQTTEFLHSFGSSDTYRGRYPGAPIGLNVPRPSTPQPPRKYVLPVEEFASGMRETSKIIQERLVRNYSTWINYWKSIMNSDDYIKYTSTKETDFLSLIFHLYDSDGEEEAAAGTEAVKLAIVERQKKRNQEKTKRLAALKESKAKFEPGMWNAQSIFMGGLGKDPEVDESELPVVIDEEIRKAAEPKDDDKRTFIGLKSQLDALRARDILNLDSHELNSNSASAAESMDVIKRIENSLAAEMSSQERLERLWMALKMPDHQRLNMTIKYCDSKYSPKLNEALEFWEKATQLVLKREATMTQLEAFERLASNPNRYFEKGRRGLSVTRLEEAKKRSKIYKKLEDIDDYVREAVLSLEIEYKDILSYEGRPYLDKMKFDKTEMLYWLQEERRNFVTRHSTSKDNRIYHLPSLTQNVQD